MKQTLFFEPDLSTLVTHLTKVKQQAQAARVRVFFVNVWKIRRNLQEIIQTRIIHIFSFKILIFPII